MKTVYGTESQIAIIYLITLRYVRSEERIIMRKYRLRRCKYDRFKFAFQKYWMYGKIAYLLKAPFSKERHLQGDTAA